MGQFEKIVVLAVLFTITVIVVISLSTGGEDADPSPLAGLGAGMPAPPETLAQARGPLPGAQLPLGTAAARKTSELAFDEPAPLPAPRPAAEFAEPDAQGATRAGWPEAPPADPLGEDLVGPGPATAAPRAPQERGRLLLSADVVDPKPPSSDLPSGSILRASAELRRTPHPDFMTYTLRPGDTFWGLAERFYGSPSRSALLSQANEGRRALRAGEEILVPIFDLASPGPERAAVGAAAPRTAAPGAGDHEVQPGENLWAISKQHYGTGARWQEIYEANQDLLRNPDAVRAGMLLRIP